MNDQNSFSEHDDKSGELEIDYVDKIEFNVFS